MPSARRTQGLGLALGVAVALSGVGLAAPVDAATARPTPTGTATTRTTQARTATFSGAPRLAHVPAKHLGAGSSATPAASRQRSPSVRAAGFGSGPVSTGSPSTGVRVGWDAQQLETFTGSFTSAGQTYPYRMVGTDPRGPGYTTTVPTTIVPISLRLGEQTVAPSSTTIATVVGSGLFTPRAFPGGTGQYGDVFLRTQFWGALGQGAKGWHVVLAPPVVTAPLVLDVPEAYGRQLTVRGVRVAFVDVDWLDAQLQTTVAAAAPAVLTQFLAGNVVQCEPYSERLDGCGIGGYHSATTDDAGTHTYSYQAFLHSAVFGAASGFHDLGPMSHELAEWISDPFTDNAVPAWVSPLAQQYGCVTALESGDPVVGKFLTIGGLTYQDEAYLAWFARQKPSSAWLGRYTWLGTFSTVSPSCPG